MSVGPGERAGAVRGGARRLRGRAVHAQPGQGRRRRIRRRHQAAGAEDGPGPAQAVARCRSRPTPPTPRRWRCATWRWPPMRRPRRRGCRHGRSGAMIGSLRGEVLERDLDGSVLIEVGGVGYVVTRVATHARRARAVVTGVPLRPPPHPRRRPDAVRLPDPRRAAHVPVADRRRTASVRRWRWRSSPRTRRSALVDIVANNDVAALTLVPGVGKKTAERLMVELRDRLSLPMLDGAGGAGGRARRWPTSARRSPGSATATTRSATCCASCPATRDAPRCCATP